jgi:Holliday junction resolvase
MSAGRRGSSRERQVMAKLRADGWIVYRAAGSHGCADLVALKNGRRPRLIQVKATAQGPYERFGPEERRLLIEEGLRAGATVVLCWWPPHRTMRWILSEAWPHEHRLERLVVASDGDVDHALRVQAVIEKER